jgi:hypothetical protein
MGGNFTRFVLVCAVGTFTQPILPAQAQDDRAHQLAAVASAQTPAHCDSMQTLADCHPAMPTGCTTATKPRYDAYLNFLKNQEVDRTLAPDKVLGENDFVDLEDSLPGGLNRNNHAQFANDLASGLHGIAEGNVYALIGYLYFVEDTGHTSQHRGESCNCQLKAAGTFDFHLGIGFDAALAQQIRTKPPVHDPKNPGEAEKGSVVAEMTPHTRDAKWTVARLNRQRGKKVKVIGQIMLDNYHANPSDDCAFQEDPQSTCWRASVWEIHPVTQFLVCKTGKTCGPDSPDSDWARLESLP